MSLSSLSAIVSNDVNQLHLEKQRWQEQRPPKSLTDLTKT